MPEFRAIQDCFVDNSFRRAGEVFEYNGEDAANYDFLELIEKPAGKKPRAVVDAKGIVESDQV